MMSLLACNQVNLPNLKATELALTGVAETQQRLLETAQALATLAAGGELPTRPPDTLTPTPSPSLTPTPLPTATITASRTPTPAVPTLTAPVNIPVLPGEIFNYFSTSNFVSYETELDLTKVAEFYDTEMTSAGWTKNNPSSYQSNVSANLVYERADRVAKVSLQYNSVARRTAIIVSITNR